MAYGTINAEQLTTQSGFTLGAGNASSFKNRIINGAMVIDQRNAGAAVTADGSYPVDRWKIVLGGGGALSAQQSTTVPSGFINSVAFTVTTPDTSLGTSDEYSFRQAIEGLNVSDLGWGTASAQTITLSFKVRSSLTGTFGGVIRNSAANRVYVFSYTITTANTFENKSITIAGDTSGTWLTTNGTGLQLIFSLGAGSLRVATAGSWGTDGAIQGVTGQTQWIGTNGATFYITGVQLEVGTVATSFDYRSYGTELGLCQRYYVKYQNTSAGFMGIAGQVSGTSAGTFLFPISMRSTPTCSYSSINVNDTSVNNPVSGAVSINANTINCVSAVLNCSAGTLTVARAALIYASAGGYIDFSAEL